MMERKLTCTEPLAAAPRFIEIFFLLFDVDVHSEVDDWLDVVDDVVT